MTMSDNSRSQHSSMTNNMKMVTDKAIITTAVQQEIDYGLSNSDILMTLNEP